MRVYDDDQDSGDERHVPQYQPRGRGGRKGKNKNGPFREDLKKLMYGYGDDDPQDDATVDLMEVYVQEFVINLVSQAMRRSQRHNNGSNSIRLADVLNVIKHDEKKYLRMPYILSTQQEINQTTSRVENNMKYNEDEEAKKTIKF